MASTARSAKRWANCTWEQYFPPSAKASTLEMVHDIEAAMGRDIDTLDWMSPTTKTRAKEKLAMVANKIGYPGRWRDYSSLQIVPYDAFGNAQRAFEFENDRELNKIGKPVDRDEWGMTPPTVNAYYNANMNDINFPAGILQPVFYDPKADLAVNYGHAGGVIGHELTHGFDDEGRKFDGKGNMIDWWTAEDTKKYEARTGCLVKEYGGFTAVDDVKVNGQKHARRKHRRQRRSAARLHGLPRPCEAAGVSTPTRRSTATAARSASLSPGHRTGARTPARRSPASAPRPTFTRPTTSAPTARSLTSRTSRRPFSCKKGQPMTPAENCRVW